MEDSEADGWATANAGGSEEVVGEVRLKHSPIHGYQEQRSDPG